MGNLTFYGLVADLEKLRTAQEENLTKVRQLVKQDARINQIEEHIIATLAIYDEIIKEYQQKNAEAERIEQYNREMDERNRSSRRHIDKPWLPLHDGE
jgi:hypothetical protein